MSFTIVCDECGSKIKIEDNKDYFRSGEKIEFLPTSHIDEDNGDIEYCLELWCKNEECKNYIKAYG